MNELSYLDESLLTHISLLLKSLYSHRLTL